MAEQLSFDLTRRPALGREDFFVSPANAVALASLDAWQDWPGGRMLLSGPEGAGKTHLAHVWAAATGARILPAAGLAQEDIPALAEGPLVIEDAEAAAGDPAAEEALFHLHNLMGGPGRPLLLTAGAPPRDWGIALPDLMSRLQAYPRALIGLPDDALLAAVLAKLFTDRQISAPPDLLKWLVRHTDRSLGAARSAVARLDAESLRSGRPVSRAMAVRLLDNPGTGGA